MTVLMLLLATPAVGGILLAFYGHRAQAGLANVAVTIVTFAAGLGLALEVFAEGPLLSPGRLFYIDAFNVYLLALTAFVGFTTALFSRPYMAHEYAKGKLGPKAMRLYHSMYQGFLFAMLLALSTNNLGVLWVAMEFATLSTVLLVSLYRTPEAVEAGWKYFILCGVGIAQALFGTVLLYFAGHLVLPDGQDALLWNELYGMASHLDPTVMLLAFVFIMVGYGTKIGLVPLHNWLPDAHSEGPTPMSAVLSGLLLNVALYAVVRIKMLVDPSQTSGLAGHIMMGFGLISFLVAGLFIHRQRDIKRMFSYSSIEHMGLMTFAFGLGGALATFGALLHMTVHSLTKSALFVATGHAAQIAGTQSIEKIRGLIRTQPAVGWSLLLGTVAIAGFPPFGVFVSEFLLLTATMQQQPWFTVALLIGLVVAFAGLFRHIHPMVYGEAPEGQHPIAVNTLPITVHLLLVLLMGVAIPPVLTHWFDQATWLITGQRVL
jgi:hydrogenase-4 component F